MSWLDLNEVQEQGSPAWHEFRSRHIGASEIPAIMGTDDWRDAEDIFKAKVFGEKFEGNFATQRGKALEPLIISLFEENKGVRLTQPTLEYPQWPTLSASLDGWIENEKAVVEVKAPALWKHGLALCGLVPETYQDQLQTQMLVSDAEKCYYVSYHPDEPPGFNLAIVVIQPNFDRQQLILNTAIRFWVRVQMKTWISMEKDDEVALQTHVASMLDTTQLAAPPDPHTPQSTQPEPFLLETCVDDQID